MGYLSFPTIKLTDPAYWVKVKGKVTAGDWRLALDAWRAYPPIPDETDPGYREANDERMLDIAQRVVSHAIVAWNLTDEHDEPLAITFENVKQLSKDDFALLREVVEKQVAGRPVEAEAPFGKSSGKRSRATTSKRRRS